MSECCSLNDLDGLWRPSRHPVSAVLGASPGANLKQVFTRARPPFSLAVPVFTDLGVSPDSIFDAVLAHPLRSSDVAEANLYDISLHFREVEFGVKGVVGFFMLRRTNSAGLEYDLVNTHRRDRFVACSQTKNRSHSASAYRSWS
jgi:hypothetical protein